MGQGFQFVDGSHGSKVDKATRKKIRSHVMKGKNSGKTFSRPSRLELSKRRPADYVFTHRTFEAPEGDEAVTTSDTLILRKVARSFGHAFVTIPSVVGFSPFALQVIHQFFANVADKLYPARFGVASSQHMTAWLQVLLTDDAAYHCTISVMETCNGFFLRNGECSPEQLYHLSQTFNLVNKRLESDQALSDSTLAVVVMLIIQEHIRSGKSEAKIHFEGLRKMVELRGGLSELESNLPLLLKICKMDISYALQYGWPLLFFRDKMPKVRASLAEEGLSLDRVIAASSIRHHGLNPELLDVVLDVIAIAHLFNEFPPGRTIGINVFQEMVISVAARLVRFHPLCDPPLSSGTEAAYHIGLILFIMTTFLQHDRRRILEFQLVCDQLRAILDRDEDDVDDDLLLWLALIGGVWEVDNPDTTWVVTTVRRLAAKLGIKTWEDVHNTVSAFPWVNALHDEIGHELWDLGNGCLTHIPEQRTVVKATEPGRQNTHHIQYPSRILEATTTTDETT